MRARNDFNGWATSVMGNDPEKIKQHFRGIQQVKGHTGMLLAEDSRAAYLAAEEDFNGRHKDHHYVMPGSGASADSRGMNQKRMPVGMLGHALGESFDLLAAGNPDVRDDRDSYALNDYMIKKFGHDPTDPSFKPRTRMDIPSERNGRAPLESRIAKMGAHTKVHVTLDSDDKATLQQITTEFNEIDNTSKNFQASLPAENKEALKATQNEYYALLSEQKKLGGKDPKVTAEISRIKGVLAEQFAPWTSDLDSESSAKRADEQSRRGEIATLDQTKADLGESGDAELGAFAQAHGLLDKDAFDARKQPKLPRGKKPETYREVLQKQISGHRATEESAAMADHDTYSVNDALRAKLMNPDRVFGSSATATARDPSVMQLIEHGMILNQEMSGPDAAKDGSSVFNLDTVLTLARHGFAPGMAFGDSMHFDYIEGYNKAVDGGRFKKGVMGPNGVDTTITPKRK